MALSSTVTAALAILPLLIVDFVAAPPPPPTTMTPRDVAKAHAAKAHTDD
jgi:hypothetical protein